ncbi:MAG TPA: flagellar hook capping FlgD N-terminal domain-containing protein [Actinomycetota bacterium]|jgi:flagellar hook assembly protein FlgD
MIGPVDGNSSSPQPSAIGALDGNAFLKLMIAQLQYQNPFQPMDTTAMMQQTSALTSVQTLQDVSALQKAILGMQEAATANGFLGRQVTATDASGATLTGLVRDVTYTAQGPLLNVGGTDVPIADITQASNAPGNGTPA